MKEMPEELLEELFITDDSLSSSRLQIRHSEACRRTLLAEAKKLQEKHRRENALLIQKANIRS